MKVKNSPAKTEMILVIGLMLILSSMFAYAATSIELTTGSFINVFGNLNLSGNNLVNAGNVSIRGNLSVDGNFSVDGNTLFVDSLGNRVGIGTTNPAHKLTVAGNVNISGNITLGQSIYLAENQSLYQPVYPSDDDLVLYLPFNAPNGSVQYDRSPYGNDGTQVGSPSCNATNGKYGAACHFNDVSGDYISVADSNSLDFGTGKFSIELWVKFDELNAAYPLVYKRTGNYGNAGQTGWRFNRPQAGNLALDLDQGATSQTVRSADGAMSTANVWYHLVGVSDGASSKVYLNGADVTSSNTIDGTANTDTSENLYINYGNHPSYIGNLTIDDVKIYKRALSAEEVRTHYLRGSGFGASGAITADTFRVVNTSGNVKFQISPSGNVGIGTASPGAKLDVEVGTTPNGIRLLHSSGTVVAKWNVTAPGVNNDIVFGAVSNNALRFITQNTERMVITDGSSGGNVGIGTTVPTEALVVVGNANITGTLYKGTTAYTNPDIAEKIPSTQLLEEGDLVVADETLDNHVLKSNKPYQNVVGVVSPNASLVIGNWRGGFDGYAVALLGRVAVKVSLENGAIKRGDALAASSKEGYAMKATQSGRIIGFALEDYDEGKKPIELEGAKTEQFKARRLRDEGIKKLKEKAKELVGDESEDIETKEDLEGLLANSITGNVVAEEVFAEMDVLEKEAKEIESNTTPKILIVLSPGWYGAEEELAFAQPSADLGYQKVNGSIILRLG